jgi:hypothetical protein
MNASGRGMRKLMVNVNEIIQLLPRENKNN